VILLLLNYYAAATALEGTWATTADFTERSGTKIFLDIQGKLWTSCRVVLMQDEAVIEDGHIVFVGLNPLSLTWFTASRGVALVRGFDGVWPSKMYYKFDPLGGHLKLYQKKVFAEMTKVY
jgi:hypothetical protein